MRRGGAAGRAYQGACLLLLAAWLVPGRAAAVDEELGEQIEQYARVQSSLEAEDQGHRATAELTALRDRLRLARQLLQADKSADLERLLRVVKPEVQLVKALVEQGAAEQRATAQRTQADELEDRVGKLQRQKEMLEQRLTLLQEQARARGQGPTPVPPGAAPSPAPAPAPAGSPKE